MIIGSSLITLIISLNIIIFKAVVKLCIFKPSIWRRRTNRVATVTPLHLGGGAQKEKGPQTFSHLVEDHVDQGVGPRSSCTITARVGERQQDRVGGQRERERERGALVP